MFDSADIVFSWRNAKVRKKFVTFKFAVYCIKYNAFKEV